MQRVVVFGNGQPAELNYFYLTNDTQYEVAGFTVDQAYIKEDRLFELPVVPFEDVETVFLPDEYKMSLSISYRNMNKLKAEKYEQAKAKGYQLISYISSRASTWPGLLLGDNSFIYEYCSICPFAQIGNNVYIGPGSVIGHHSVIGDHCFIGPNATILGSTIIEPYCVIGSNSCIRDGGIVIARECIIGTGVSINKDTRERGVYINRPAELMRKPSNELDTWLTWDVDLNRTRTSSD
jgi:sugar O-acyltransferase (sialic acid O-acetyltransferase NeuD family)